MIFKDTNFNAILNVHGDVLTIVMDLVDNALYLKALGLNQSGYIYTKLKVDKLQLYFNSKITLKELFLTNIQELYFIKTKFELPPPIQPLKFDQNDAIFDSIEFGNKLYNELSKEIKLENSYEDIMKKLK